MVNTDIQKKYNISDNELRKPLSELSDVLDKVYQGEKDNQNLQVLDSYGFSQDCYFDYITECVGVDLLDNNLKAENIFKNEQVKKNIINANTYFKKGYLVKSEDFREQMFILPTHIPKYKNGYKFSEEHYSDGDKKLYTLNFKYLLYDDNDYLLNNQSDTSFNSVASWSENKGNAFNMLYLVNTDKDIVNLLEYGLDGKDYKLENGEITILQSHPDRSLRGNVYFLNNFMTTKVKDSENDPVLDKKEGNEAKSSPILGFKLDSSKIKQEIDDTNKITLEWSEKLASNDEEDASESLEEFNSELEKAAFKKSLMRSISNSKVLKIKEIIRKL